MQPVVGLTRKGALATFGGWDDQGNLIQPLSGDLHEMKYFDYMTLARFVRPTLRVNGKSMGFSEFFSSIEYALEFRFDKTSIAARAYPYSPELAKFVEKNKRPL